MLSPSEKERDFLWVLHVKSSQIWEDVSKSETN